ncbi:MAG: ABC transporter permease [bacterium]|nr:ABC transporter permease [bacterium]
MKEYIKIAWRNIWRNRKRSLITISSIFFAAFLALIMRSFQLGSYDNMIHNVVEMFSGYIQIEHKDFPDDKTIDNSIVYSEDLVQKLSNVDNVSSVVPRLTYFALASSGTQTKGIMVCGVDPELENKMTKIKDKLISVRLTEEAINKIENEGFPDDLFERIKKNKNKSYSNDEILIFELDLDNDESEKYLETIKKHAKYQCQYLTSDDTGAVIGDALAKYLLLDVGDTLVMMGQGYHGNTAANKFPVRGIVKIPNPKLDALSVYLPLKKTQEFYSAFEVSNNMQDTSYLISSYAINVTKKKYPYVSETREKIKNVINSKDYSIRTWKEANRELNQQIESDNESGKMMIGLLYIVIAFGVFGTVLMMIAERKREMGVMIAIGMKKFKLAIIITIEMLFISMVAMLAGILLSIPIVLAGHYNPLRLTGDMAKMIENYGMEPVMPMAAIDMYYLYQIMVVVFIVLVVMIYPIISIIRLKVINALRA